MAKAGAPKKKKAKPKLTDKKQSERFKEAARELGVDESGNRFDEALEKIILERERIKSTNQG
jgi:hypothetical protein